MRKLALVLAVGLCLNSGVVGQQVIIGNLPPTNDGTQTADVDALRQKGMRFTMPISASALAGDLILRLRNYDTVGDAPIAELRDFTGSTTAPGVNVLLTFTAAAPGGLGILDYTFTPVGSFSLVANTSYWIVVRGNAASSFDWMASSPAVTPTGLATWGSTSFTTNGGGSWANSAIITSFQFLEAVSVPEPATMWTIGISAGLAATYGVRRYQKRKKRVSQGKFRTY